MKRGPSPVTLAFARKLWLTLRRSATSGVVIRTSLFCIDRCQLLISGIAVHQELRQGLPGVTRGNSFFSEAIPAWRFPLG
jgi:hypothetical protein